MSIIALGEHGSGKSTIMGRLFHELKDEPLGNSKHLNETSENLVDFAKKMEYSAQPRESSQPQSISKRYIQLKDVSLTLIDVYNFRKYKKHLLCAASQSDVALLVVSARKTDFERILSKDSATVQHALIAFTIGIRRVIVAVNQMDVTDGVAWNNRRFSHIKSQMTQLLEKIGFNCKRLVFVPLSGRSGDNLTCESKHMDWFFGGSLLQAIKNLSHLDRTDKSQKPFRLTITQIRRLTNGTTVAIGRVHSGQIDLGSDVVFSSGLVSKVTSIQVFGQSRATACEGDHIGYTFEPANGPAPKSGDVVSCLSSPVKQAKSFVAQIMVLGDTGRFKRGYCPVVNCHAANVSCKVLKLLNKINPKSGRIVQENPEFLQKGDCARVEFKPTIGMSVQTCRVCPRLGKIFIRENKRILAIGVVTKVNY